MRETILEGILRPGRMSSNMKRGVVLINKRMFVNWVCTVHGRKEFLNKYLQMLPRYAN